MPETNAMPTAPPRVNIIAAVAENGVIGANGAMPWRLPDEMRYFKRMTVGHVVIMGRRTFESFGGKPLPDRRLLVVTRNLDYQPSIAEHLQGSGTVEVAHSLDEARGWARDTTELFVAGGCELYRETLPLAERLCLTRVHAQPEGDTFFPDVHWAGWTLAEQHHHDADPRHDHAFTMNIYVRRNGQARETTPDEGRG